ncbi:MAG TPA: MarR family winged helix-turn-helix transcriptional regulator [Gaiellaceae bacterium]|nr:MarR family winged helix-turn-helix transcriptional regulator [Gaiellaceae bacterium]
MPREPRQDGLFAPNLFLQFFLTAQPVGKLVEQAIRASGMSAGDYAVLSAIDELAPVTPADVSRLTGVPRPTLSAVIGRLTHAGHVKRRRHPSDGRSYTLELTARGRKTKDENGRALLDAAQALESHLEDSGTAAVLERLRQAAEAALG